MTGVLINLFGMYSTVTVWSRSKHLKFKNKETRKWQEKMFEICSLNINSFVKIIPKNSQNLIRSTCPSTSGNTVCSIVIPSNIVTSQCNNRSNQRLCTCCQLPGNYNPEILHTACSSSIGIKVWLVLCVCWVIYLLVLHLYGRQGCMLNTSMCVCWLICLLHLYNRLWGLHLVASSYAVSSTYYICTVDCE